MAYKWRMVGRSVDQKNANVLSLKNIPPLHPLRRNHANNPNTQILTQICVVEWTFPFPVGMAWFTSGMYKYCVYMYTLVKSSSQQWTPKKITYGCNPNYMNRQTSKPILDGPSLVGNWDVKPSNFETYPWYLGVEPLTFTCREYCRGFAFQLLPMGHIVVCSIVIASRNKHLAAKQEKYSPPKKISRFNVEFLPPGVSSQLFFSPSHWEIYVPPQIDEQRAMLVGTFIFIPDI